MADDIPDSLSVPLVWVGLEDVPIVFANQVIGQIDDRGDVIVAFGQASPPVMPANLNDDERRAQLGDVKFVQCKPVTRLSMSRVRVEETITALQEILEIRDRYLGS